MADEEERCIEVDWVIAVGNGLEEASKRRARRVVSHITEDRSGKCCRDCHVLGMGYSIPSKLREGEMQAWRRGFQIISDAAASAGRRVGARGKPVGRNPEPSFREIEDAEAAKEAEIRRLWRQMVGLPITPSLRDRVFLSALHPPPPEELN